jgi:hypothetical protein
LKFSIGVGLGERISGKEFGENWSQGLIFDEKITILPVDHHSGHKVGFVFILSKNIAKCNDMPYGRRSAEIGNLKWPPRGFLAHFSM